jgi:YD repeat-containing protein
MSRRTRVDSIDLAAAVASDTITVASTQVAELTNIGDRVIYAATGGADPLSAPTERLSPGETVEFTADFKVGSPLERCKAFVKFVTPSVPASVVSEAQTATAYTYDSSGNVLTATRDGVTTTYTYDGDGNVLTASRTGRVETFAYAAGVLTGSTVVLS